MVGERGCLWPDYIKSMMLFMVILAVLLVTVSDTIFEWFYRVFHNSVLGLATIVSISMILTSLVRWVLKI